MLPDNVDLAAATRHGVVVTNTPTAPTISVAEFTLGMTLALVKHLIPMHNALEQGEWRHIRGVELRGKTFGMIGLGLIAAELAPAIRALGMRLVGWSFTPDAERARRLGSSCSRWTRCCASPTSSRCTCATRRSRPASSAAAS